MWSRCSNARSGDRPRSWDTLTCPDEQDFNGDFMRVLTLRQRSRFSATAAMALAWVLASTASAQAPTAEERLATEVMRSALAAAATTPLTPEALDIACILANEAVQLDHDNVGLWRLTLDFASLAEREDLRARRWIASVNWTRQTTTCAFSCSTVRWIATPPSNCAAAAYEQLLDKDNIERLGPGTASRLALDLALLKQRLGDTDGFARWLTRSLELDRSNRSAAALAAGFFQANVSDAVGRAELLTNLVLADPTDIQTQIDLAELLLENGAYVAAARIYDATINASRAAKAPVSTSLMADVAIAQWAADDVEGSLTTMDRRQNEIDEAYRAEQARLDRSLTMAQIVALRGPTDPTLATIAAVIHAGRRDAEAGAAIQAAIAASEAEIKAAPATMPPEELAEKHLHLAWLALWLGDDAVKPTQHVDAAAKLRPLTDQERQRFDGFQAIKRGEFNTAIELLTPIAKTDSAAGVGLAVALERDGREKDAARELLALNKAQPGSIIGIWASQQLTRILGQRLPLSAEASALERLIASISRTFDRYPSDPSMALAMRITPANVNPGAFDPILVTVELINTSTLPLAIDRDGPLRPQVLVVPQISTAIPLKGSPKAFVIDLNSRLRLAPHASVSATFDLRWYEFGDLLNMLSPAGGIVKLTLLSNFIATASGDLVPGLFGLEAAAPLLRVNGVSDDKDWIAKAIVTLNDAAAAPDDLMLQAALVGNEIALTDRNPNNTAELKELLTQAKAALPIAFGRLDAGRQAWVLSVMSRLIPVEAVLDIARKSDSRLVRLAYVIAHLKGGGSHARCAASRRRCSAPRTR